MYVNVYDIFRSDRFGAAPPPVPGQYQRRWESGRRDRGPSTSASTTAGGVRWQHDPWHNAWGGSNQPYGIMGVS